MIIFLVFGSVFFNFFNLLRNKNNQAAERNRSAEHSLGNPALHESNNKMLIKLFWSYESIYGVPIGRLKVT